MKNSYLTATDQFCGAGGSSQLAPVIPGDTPPPTMQWIIDRCVKSLEQ